jgi:squalene-hopene/tetraprenyl-beta-curcumene cyclase
MTTLPLLLLSSVLAAEPAPAADAPSPDQVRKAVERSLPFLEKSSLAWREERGCVSCHQVPFALWPLHEARARGLAVDAARLDDLTDWSLDFCMTNKNKDQFTGGFLSTMGKLALALESAPKTKKTTDAYAFFEPIIARNQRDDGSWKEGNFIGVKGAEREGIEVDTLWTILGLNAIEKQAGDALPEANRTSLAKQRDKALAWLKAAKPATRTDWLALRMVVEQESGNAKEAARWRQALLDRQNADGGWPFVKDGASHPLVTGECLYLLSAAGAKADDPAVRRACEFLVETQQEDGSWKTNSRQALGDGNPEKVNKVTIHWGTGWAAVGLLRTLPPKP